MHYEDSPFEIAHHIIKHPDLPRAEVVELMRISAKQVDAGVEKLRVAMKLIEEVLGPTHPNLNRTFTEEEVLKLTAIWDVQRHAYDFLCGLALAED